MVIKLYFAILFLFFYHFILHLVYLSLHLTYLISFFSYIQHFVIFKKSFFPLTYFLEKKILYFIHTLNNYHYTCKQGRVDWWWAVVEGTGSFSPHQGSNLHVHVCHPRGVLYAHWVCRMFSGP